MALQLSSVEPTARETAILIACCRTQLDPGHRETIAQLAGQNVDWGRVIHTAQDNKVLPLLQRNLQFLAEPRVPEHVRKELHQRAQALALRNLGLAGELIEILAIFEARGIRAIPWKGPCLAADAYANLALRPFGDLDLLVRPEDFRQVRERLAERGYRPALPIPPHIEEVHLAANGELPFVRDFGPIYVDLHISLSKRHLAIPLGWRDLAARLKPVRVAGRAVRTLAPEDHLLVLAIHGAKHQWVILGLIVDIAELIRAHPEMDWRLVEKEARRVRCLRMLLLALKLASDMLGTAIPEEMGRLMGADWRVRRLAAKIGAKPFQGVRRRRLKGVMFDVQVRDHLRDGVRSAMSLAVSPNVSDSEWVHLPRALAPLMYLIRAVRLAGRYIRAASRSVVRRPPGDAASPPG